MKIKITKKAKKKIKEEIEKQGDLFDKNCFHMMEKVLLEILADYSRFFPSKTIFVITESDGFNANNSPISNKKFYIISFTWLWIYYLWKKPSDRITAAFIATLGHELGHSKAGHYLPFFFITKRILDRSTKRECFMLRAVEVFCDFNAIEVLNTTKENLIQAKEYEYEENLKYKVFKKETDFMHPTNAQRLEYLREYDYFCKEILIRIAEDNSYYDQKAIDSTWAYYSKVINENGYIRWWTRLLSILSAGITIVLIIWGIPLMVTKVFALFVNK